MKKILIVGGGGGIGRKHIDGFLRTEKFAVSICEIDAAKREETKAKFKIEKAYADFYAAPLEEFDAVLIATPANFHIPMAVHCARRSVTFLLEKPLSVSMDGVDNLIETVKKNSVRCAVAYTRRSIPSHLKIHQLIQSGFIGKLKMANFYVGQDYRKIRTDYKNIYFARRDMGGGVLLDFISHCVDLAQWLLGKHGKGYALCANLVFGDEIETEDSALAIGRFGEGLACFYCNAFQKPNEVVFDFAGTAGNLKFVFVTRTLSKLYFSNDDSGHWEEIARFENEGLNYYYYQAENFYNFLIGRPSTFTTLEEAAENLRFVLGVREAAF